MSDDTRHTDDEPRQLNEVRDEEGQELSDDELDAVAGGVGDLSLPGRPTPRRPGFEDPLTAFEDPLTAFEDPLTARPKG